MEDKRITKNNEMADTMNDIFCNIGEKLRSNIPDTVNPLLNGDYSTKNDSAHFEFRMISPDDLVNVMAKFKKSNGFGVDPSQGFFSRLGCLFWQRYFMIYLIGRSHQELSTKWRIAMVSPIYKDGNIED